MSSTSLDVAFGVLQPGDADYPLQTEDGAAGSIAEIRKRFNAKSLYEDPDFPATDDSIGEGKNKYVWLRPHEICDKFGSGKPKFAVAQPGSAGEVCSGLDIRQGGLSDCWYLSALATLTLNPSQLKVVIPEDNFDGFDDTKYCGAFHFRFYNMAAGKYVDVVIDDRIPCWKTGLRPAFAKALMEDGKDNEFWSALTEKAFAKYRGSYHALKGGNTSSALVYFTGGFSDSIVTHEYRGKEEKYDKLVKAVKRYLDSQQCLFGVETYGGREEAQKAGSAEGYTKFGLLYGHAYSVLGGAEVKEKNNPDKVRMLLMLKNPWGHSEWKGELSDGDDEGWAKLDEDLRPRHRKQETAAKIDEGVFWIDLRDIIKYFSTLECCLYGLDDGTKFCSVRSQWPAALQDEKIRLTDKNSFYQFPAFSFEAKRELVSVQLPPEYAGKCVFVLRIVAGSVGFQLEPIPRFVYHIYEIRDGDDLKNLDKIYKTREPVDSSGPSGSEVLSKLGVYVKPGRYFITLVLQTDDKKLIPKGYEGKPIPFALSLYTENETKLEQIN